MGVKVKHQMATIIKEMVSIGTAKTTWSCNILQAVIYVLKIQYAEGRK